MNSTEENVELLSRAILNEAQTETEHLKADAQAKADLIRGQATLNAESERSVILEQAAAEAQQYKSQSIATAQLKSRALELEHREKMLNEVFEIVRQQLPKIQSREDYPELISLFVREAVLQLGASNVQICADGMTEKLFTGKFLETLSKTTNAKLSIGKTLEHGLGVIVDASEGHLYFDNTLETRLNRIQSRLRSSVFRILMGESNE